jgi:hypothetical protein
LKKQILLVVVFTLFVALSFGLNQPLTYGTSQSSHDSGKLKNVGISMELPTVKPFISEDEAISAAKNFLGSQATNAKISAEYWNITNKSFKDFPPVAKEKNSKLNNGQNSLPTWIVSFRDITIPRRGPVGYKLAAFTEINIVIDALTGEILYRFSYR